MQRRSTAVIPKKSQQRSPLNSATSPRATVVRNTCGTGPFDKYWLNVDCCGLVCAVFTYWLHLYGCYAVCMVLLPPWMSHQEEGEERKVREEVDLRAILYVERHLESKKEDRIWFSKSLPFFDHTREKRLPLTIMTNDSFIFSLFKVNKMGNTSHDMFLCNRILGSIRTFRSHDNRSRCSSTRCSTITGWLG